jgi:beta-glucosidase
MRKFFLLSVVTFLLFSCAKQQVKYPYQNVKLPIDQRVEDLISRMTIEEKISQLNYESAAIDSLGVSAYNWWNECLHGVARAGLATVFPQAIGMAATWDEELIFNVASAISDEARAKYHEFQRKGKSGIYQGLTFWTPNINIFRDPRWGRGMETYGEDPVLTGKIAVQFIKGLQGDDPKYLKTVATSKHFAVHSGPEYNRHSFDANVSTTDLRETYLPAFKRTIDEANVQSFMCAYNRLYGKPCCGSSPLLNDILRDEWKFKGYVVSDCWALVDFYDGHNVVETKAEAAAMAFKNGTDLNCGNTSPFLKEAFEKGMITEVDLNVPLRRLFKARFMLGMFDPDKMVPYANIPYSVVDCQKHKDLALETARKSMVLLKNENQLLPLNKSVKKVAVIGPNANDVDALLANYHGIPSEAVTPYLGIKAKLKDAEVNFALGCEHAEGLPTFEVVPQDVLFTDATKTVSGLKAEYFDTAAIVDNPEFTKVDPNVDFYWWDNAPFEELDDDDFAVKWSGVIVPKISGKYALGLQGRPIFNLYLDGKQIVKHKSIHEHLKKYEFVELKAGQTYKIDIEYIQDHGEAEVRLIWALPDRNFEKEALDLAAASDVVILCMGLSPRLEGEEMKVNVDGFSHGDRLMIDLPKLQVEFMKKIKALNKPTVLVMLNGSAVAINWEAENMPAILEAWYPGQAGGHAIADVLFGDYNPAGRLPLTYYKSVNDIPHFEDYNMKGRTYRYFDKEPLFAFGYGLSYTTFEYTTPKVDRVEVKKNGTVKVSVDVKNTGSYDGDEVVQLYVKSNEKENAPIKSLKAFKRIKIAKGETKTITFSLSADEFKSWNETANAYVVEKGAYQIMVGASSRDKDLKSVSVNVIE